MNDHALQVQIPTHPPPQGYYEMIYGGKKIAR